MDAVKTKSPAEIKDPSVKDLGTFVAEKFKERNLAGVNSHAEPVTPRVSFYTKYGKRFIDICCGAVGLIVFFPVNLVLGLCTFFDVGRPIFFKQSRAGKDGKAFNLYKFRNMTNAKDEHGNLLPPSQRVTKFGQFVRKYSLDELLNFWSVFKGDMSIIGPRPLPMTFMDRYSDRHKMRHAVKPGLECPDLRADGHVRLYHEQFENDVWYAENISLKVDIQMIIGLFKMVFNRKERGDHAKVGGGEFLGYNDDGIATSMRRIPQEYIDEYEAYCKECEVL